MEFKEKLQLLRTNMKLSQEELANKLAISRQSITNGKMDNHSQIFKT